MTTTPADSAATSDCPKLISLAVHEMRTPTSVVIGYLRMLLNDTSVPLNERHRRMIGEAEKACARLVDMLTEFSDVGKMDAGTAVLHEDRFDLFELTLDLTARVDEPLDREVTLRHRGAPTGAPFRGDRARIAASLMVAMRAVVREQPAGTAVIVDAQRITREGRGFARVVVSPEPDVARSAESAPTEFDDRRGGLGLGLPLARRVIARYGGRIWTPLPPDGEPLPIGSRGSIVILLPID